MWFKCIHSNFRGAFRKRTDSGLGSSIKISLFDSLSEWMNVPIFNIFILKSSKESRPLAHPSIVPYGCFISKDNTNILFSIQNEREWVSFEENILKLPEKLKKKFINPTQRLKYKIKLNKLISKAFKLLNSKKITYYFKKGNIAYGFLNNIKDFSKHTELKTSYLSTANGKIKFIPPVRIKNKKNYKKIPKLGEHTKKIKKEFY